MTESLRNDRTFIRVPRFLQKRPDIEGLRQKKDIRGLTRLLQHPNFTVQWQAAEALGTLGPEAVDHLFRGLYEHNLAGRLGAIEALADIKDRRAVDPLINLLSRDHNNEIRWASALALGEIGDPRATEALLQGIIEPDKYVRFGSAVALRQLGWTSRNPEEEASFYIALQEWEQIPRLGKAAIGSIIRMMDDPDPDVRYSAIQMLEKMHHGEGKSACDQALRDRDSKIRWKAVTAAKKCGLPFSYLPWSLHKRVRKKPSSAVAAFLNFLFGGAGYDYLNLWWGGLVFQIYFTTLLICTLFPVTLFRTWTCFIYLNIPGIPIPFPISLLPAAHAWYMTEKMPDL
jgi:HEAT repeat protein